jgi:hypothetical protein
MKRVDLQRSGDRPFAVAAAALIDMKRGIYAAGADLPSQFNSAEIIWKTVSVIPS